MRAPRALPLLPLLLVACAQQPDYRAETAPPEAVTALDLERYQGLWYEIARYPNRFERGCTAVTARYALREDGKVAVTNSCLKDGERDVAEGVARRTGEATLRVRFAPSWVPFAEGDYWVLALEPDYSAALVGSPDGKYLWILSRTPSLSGEVLDRMIAEAEARGYDADALELTPQPAGPPSA
ncbi:lipocalin family protein [Parvularcula dongshanensis]|uniref:Outer membrane lipoprotein Blc n=1 Tax=Parvularcula dongshanensis TaxID=1173995 RepID=A0A840I5K1_9PROT|nr:lipocalin family protein [Parvularcula dongshanensis]MBB4659553.1 apolipoprotein D and lipocalin family protein [Parvularcula dongshanensis]